MKSLRHLLATPALVVCLLMSGGSVNAGVGVSVNLHLGHYPELVPIPDYPVYYAPHVAANFFFYDGAYWLFEEGHWFTSHWYDGPWHYVDPFYVPAFILRIPVRYYRVPPPWFRGWYFDAPPRWGHHWGPHWSQRRYGWDQWDRHRAPKPAPLPHYQRDYRGDHYPRGDRQQERRIQERPRPEPRPQPAMRHPEHLRRAPVGYRHDAESGRRDSWQREHHESRQPSAANEGRSRGDRPPPHEHRER
jgi:hypothetical protein